MFFSAGVIFTTNAGNYWLDIFNDYSASINLLVIGFLQIVVVMWLFGGIKWMNEVQWMVQPPTSGLLALVYRIIG